MYRATFAFVNVRDLSIKDSVAIFVDDHFSIFGNIDTSISEINRAVTIVVETSPCHTKMYICRNLPIVHKIEAESFQITSNGINVIIDHHLLKSGIISEVVELQCWLVGTVFGQSRTHVGTIKKTTPVQLRQNHIRVRFFWYCVSRIALIHKREIFEGNNGIRVKDTSLSVSRPE